MLEAAGAKVTDEFTVPLAVVAGGEEGLDRRAASLCGLTGAGEGMVAAVLRQRAGVRTDDSGDEDTAQHFGALVGHGGVLTGAGLGADQGVKVEVDAGKRAACGIAGAVSAGGGGTILGAVVFVGEDDDNEVGVVAKKALVGSSEVLRAQRIPDGIEAHFDGLTAIARLSEAAEISGEPSSVNGASGIVRVDLVVGGAKDGVPLAA